MTPHKEQLPGHIEQNIDTVRVFNEVAQVVEFVRLIHLPVLVPN